MSLKEFFINSEYSSYRAGLVMLLQLVTIILLGVLLFMPLVKVQVSQDPNDIKKISIKDSLGLIIQGIQVEMSKLDKLYD